MSYCLIEHVKTQSFLGETKQGSEGRSRLDPPVSASRIVHTHYFLKIFIDFNVE